MEPGRPPGWSALIATLTIDTIAAGGDGVARHGGMVVFVPRTAPGDVVTASVQSRGRYARALEMELVSPSADRIDPPCQHYTRDSCGGCQLQHMSYAAQLAAKQRIVRDALQRIGRREVALPFIRPSEQEWRYRSKLTLALRRRGSRWIGGLHRYDAPGRIFPLADCPITRREIVRVWRDVLAASEHFPEARELRGSVRATATGFSFTLQGGTRWGGHMDFFDATPSVTSLWWKPEGEEVRSLQTRDGGDSSEAAATGAAFVQVNPTVAAELHRHVLERARAHSPAHVIDGYSGTGATALPLASAGIRVTAIELDRWATAAVSRRLEPPSVALAGRVEDHIGAALPADVVLLNPPRAGVDGTVTSVLGTVPEAPRAVIYVSCDPATLARDLSRLQRYRIESLVAFDMFPQTAHVETVCELVAAE
jgi:23S rRNA (uracil1939-C5)-methyltransferase